MVAKLVFGGVPYHSKSSGKDKLVAYLKIRVNLHHIAHHPHFRNCDHLRASRLIPMYYTSILAEESRRTRCWSLNL